MRKTIKIVLIIAIILIVGYTAFYFTEYHHAEKTAIECLNGTDNVSVTKIDSGLFVDGPGDENAIIFYPGAKNEYIAYLPIFVNLAGQGVDCYLVQMPFNFAIFGQNTADSLIDNSNYTHYFLSGHSLGGLSAASYMKDSGKGDGLIMLAAYPVVEVTKPVLSIYGTQDGILNMKAYNESKPLMSNLTEYVIQGGNHEQFAYYGAQEGDYLASITPRDQQGQTASVILDFINGFN